ncbi:MAG: ABC transporter permease [Paracoccaceae bacterium]
MTEAGAEGARSADPAGRIAAAAGALVARGGSGTEAFLLSALALVAAFLLFGLFVALLGHDPVAVYRVLWLGAFGTRFSIENTLTLAAPIVLTALCTLIPARIGLLVIGAEGALAMGGLGAVLAGLALSGALGGLPWWLAVALLCAAGALAGGLWIGAAGALRHWRGVNETISTLLMNYIAAAVLMHLVSGPIRDFSVSIKAQSHAVPEALRMGDLPGWSVHWGLVVGMVAVFALHVLLRHTTTGFSMAVLGGNPRAARMAGLPIGRLTLLACGLGGAAAGLAGAIEVVAVHGAASESLLVGFGYTGILVAFLARQNPLAVLVVALVIGGIAASGGLLQRRFGMPDAATDLLQGTIFLCVLASNALSGRLVPGAR